MDQQIRNEEYRIVFVFTDIDLYDGAVLLCNDAVQRQRQGYPLIFLDTAVIMSIQEGKIGILIQRVLLDVQSGGIDMCTQNV